MKEIIIDCDPGVDDATAIAMALKNPSIKVRGITTVAGNVGLEKTTKNALKTLEFFEKGDIPVYRGNNKPLRKEYVEPIFSIHGTDGLGDSGLLEPQLVAKDGAVDFIVSQLEAQPGQITVIALGPLTNIAQVAERVDTRKFCEIYIMGGAFWVAGNVTEFAEFNAFTDPDAAKIVYESGIPIKVVGLDVTNRVAISRQDFEDLKKLSSRQARFFVKICKNFVDKSQKPRSAFFWDPIAMAWFIDESLIRTEKGSVTVVTDSLQRGQTKFINGEGNVEVASSIDSRRFFEIFFDFLQK